MTRLPMAWMTFRRGEIYLANFNPSKGSEPGKVRPCLVLQNDALNMENHKTTAVLPLTTRLIDDGYPMRIPINRRDNLRRNSQIMIDQIQSIDIQRFTGSVLTVLSAEELVRVEESLMVVLDLSK
jgi:mRNA interferase MazF